MRAFRVLPLTLVTLALAASAVRAQAPAGGAPAPALSLEEAVRLTLERDPDLALARQRLALQAGRSQEARGVFDHTFSAFPVARYERAELLPSGVAREVKRRDVFRLSATALEDVSDQIDQALLDIDRRPTIECEGTLFTFNGRDVCLDTGLRSTAENFDDFLRQLAQAGFPDLAAIRDNLNALTRQFLGEARDNFRSTAAGLRESLRKLGEIPDVEEETSLLVDFRYNVPLRSGAVVSAGIQLEGLEDNYDGKPLNPALGGKGVPTTFTSIAALGLDVPLGRGRGTISSFAPVLAAEATYAASQEELRQAITEQTLETVLAYWNLAAAQQVLGLLERSSATQERLQEISRALVAGDELPRTDLSLVEARTAGTRSAVIEARQAVLDARFALARAMGVTVEDLGDAPLAADPLPEVPAPDVARPPVDALLRDALSRRNDLRAAEKLREASEVLERAARSDLRRRVDLSILAGYNSVYESFRYDFYEPRGFEESITGRWVGPSYSVTFRFDLPIRNNAARGRLLQADASLGQSEITARNLRRTIQSNVVELSGSLRDAAAAAASRRLAAGYYEQTISSSEELYRAGELSVTDTLLTEQQLTQTQIELVRASQAYAALLASLRFTTGDLIQPGAGRVEPTAEDFRPFPAAAER